MSEMAPEGVYYAKLRLVDDVNANLVEIGDNKTPAVEVYIEVTHESSNGEWVVLDKPLRRSITWWASEKAWPYTIDKMEKLGFDGDFSDIKLPDLASGFEVYCRHDVYNQKANEKWDLTGMGGGSASNKAGDDLVAKMKAKYAAKKGPTAAEPAVPPKKPSSPPPSPAPDDAGREGPELDGGDSPPF